MKTKLFLLVIAACFVTISQAQQKFNVQNGTKAEFYNDLETAIENAASGDTIYLPGRVVQVQQNLVINKKLALIGAGWSTGNIGGLQTTEIKRSGNYAHINFSDGASGSLIMGCLFERINVSGSGVSDITIWRNRVMTDIVVLSSTSQRIIIRENVLREINGGYASDCLIQNNLCASVIGFTNTQIFNNVAAESIYGLAGCNIDNNYIGNMRYGFLNVSNTTYKNNAFGVDVTFPAGNNTGINNLTNQTFANTFTGNDYALPETIKIKDTSPCKNAGSDGTDIGVYGGPTPFKETTIPINPHITKTSISSQTDKDGKLRVAIQVSAQTE